ncbi:peptidase C14 caspase catalytic subunit p20 [Roseibium sp. TrichSKD4]|uniref:caspase family protein n=1 Tax=Roseibium sp. TrichSKD4 TaxID=744980 RepID=UPI0001E56AF1|nr:caspase family protein [Roseibium sp. TrichSKD4]EFO32569.1 peptidase C14 caspase catalytic subunit p20 [Roseibium sp. TrichSKD4]
MLRGWIDLEAVRKAILISTMILTFQFLADLAHAERHALVIGNDAYLNVTPLTRAVKDAEEVTKALEFWEFEVLFEKNLTRIQFYQTLQKFVDRVETGDEVVFFFSGHGVGIDQKNYLLPIDVPDLGHKYSLALEDEARTVSSILKRIRDKGTRINIFIIDACRNNPFSSEGSKGGNLPFGLIGNDPPHGSVIIHSAAPGKLAYEKITGKDDNDKNSLFVRSLVPLLKNPQLSILDIGEYVKGFTNSHANEMGLSQVPEVRNRLLGHYFFNPDLDQEYRSIIAKGKIPEFRGPTIEEFSAASRNIARAQPKATEETVTPKKRIKTPEQPLDHSPTSDDVSKLQATLMSLVYPRLAIDGKYGPKSEKALQRYLDARKLTALKWADNHSEILTDLEANQDIVAKLFQKAPPKTSSLTSGASSKSRRPTNKSCSYSGFSLNGKPVC